MTRLFAFLLLLFSVFDGYAQSEVEQAAKLMKEADSLTDARVFAQANERYLRLVSIYSRQSQADDLLTTLNKLSLNYLRLGDHVSATSILEDRNFELIEIGDSLILSDSYYYLGVAGYYSGQFEDGLMKAKQSLRIKLCQGTRLDSLKLSLNYNILGILQNQLGINEPAIDSYNQYLNIVLQLEETDANRLQVANAYNNIGVIYAEQMIDHERALAYYDKSIKIKAEILGEDHPMLAESYNNTANLLIEDNPQEALTYLRKAVRIFEREFPHGHLSVVTSYNSIADCFYELGSYDSAHYYLDRVIRLGGKYLGEVHYEVALAHSLKFAVCKATGQKEKAIAFGEKAIAIYESTYPNGFEIAQEYFRMAEFYLAENTFEKALDYVEKSIDYSFLSDTVPDLSNIQFDQILQPRILLNALDLKANLLQQIGGNAGEIARLYDAIFEVYQGLLPRYQSEYSNSFIREGLYRSVEGALSQLTEFDEQAFYTIRKAKNIFFKTFLRNPGKSTAYSDIPDSVLRQEQQLKEQIAALENQLLMAKADGRRAIDKLEDQLFVTKRELDDLKRLMRLNYKKYFELMYSIDVFTVQDVQKQLRDHGQALIEYFMGEETIYLFAITPSDYQVVRIARDEAFDQYLKQYRSGLDQPQILNPQLVDYQNFMQASVGLFDYLIAPVDTLIAGKHLVIIPDGELSLIPFEALVTAEVAGNAIDYQSIPYLIRRQEISYVSALSLLMAGDERRSSAGNELLAFAPEFGTAMSGEQINDSVRSALLPLKWARSEVSNISQHFNAVVYFADRATEKVFREQAVDYDIIHVASHAMVSDENPLYSRIAFTMDETDSLNDGYLHTFELYNATLNAEMMVLSGCNTGYGQWIKGEGVLNLARGCFYAGARSVVMSLWVANDRSTAYLMDRFYHHLAQGLQKNEALRNAKLDYLNQHGGIAAHPYYWSQFVLSGDVTAIESANRPVYYGYLVAGLLIALSLILTLRKGLIRSSNRSVIP